MPKECGKCLVKECSNDRCIQADGRFRLVMAADGMLPGPEIRVTMAIS